MVQRRAPKPQLCTHCVHFLYTLRQKTPSQGFDARRVPNQYCERDEFTIALPIERDVSLSKDLAPPIADIAMVERNQLCNVAKILLGDPASVARQNAASIFSELKLSRALTWPSDCNMDVNRLSILSNPEEQNILPKRQYFRHQAIARSEARRSASSKISGALFRTKESSSTSSSPEKPVTSNHLCAGNRHRAESNPMSTGLSTATSSVPSSRRSE